MKKETKTNNMPATDGFRPAHIGERPMPVHTISTGEKILVMYSDGTIQVTTKVESEYAPEDIQRSVQAILSVARGEQKVFLRAADEEKFEDVRKYINEQYQGIRAERDVFSAKKVKFTDNLLNIPCTVYHKDYPEHGPDVPLSEVVSQTTRPIVIVPEKRDPDGKYPEFGARQNEWYNSVRNMFPEHKLVKILHEATRTDIRKGEYSEKLVIFAEDVLPRNYLTADYAGERTYKLMPCLWDSERNEFGLEFRNRICFELKDSYDYGRMSYVFEVIDGTKHTDGMTGPESALPMVLVPQPIAERNGFAPEVFTRLEREWFEKVRAAYPKNPIIYFVEHPRLVTPVRGHRDSTHPDKVIVLDMDSNLNPGSSETGKDGRESLPPEREEHLRSLFYRAVQHRRDGIEKTGA